MRAPILVMAYNNDIALLLMTLLQIHGHPSLRARHGQEALVLAAQCRPALVFLDTPVPDMSTDRLADELRLLNAGPIVLFSALDDGPLIAQRIGAEGYVPKPFDLADITACLELLHPCEHAVGM